MATNAHTHVKADQKKKAMISAKRNREIYELRLKGWAPHEIADKFNLDPSRISQIITAVLDEQQQYNKELGKRLLEMELDRLDKLALALHTQAMQDGDPRAIDSYLKIMERRAKMVGLDIGKEENTEQSLKVYVGFNGPDDWDKEKEKS